MPDRTNSRRDRGTDRLAVRGMWTGTIGFGLVSVPVSLFPALRSRPVHLRWLAPDGTPVSRRYVCPDDGQSLGPDDLVRGYELDDGRMVVVEDDELDAVAPDAARDIAIEQFVDLDEVPVHMYDRPYFLVPTGGSVKAYQLLAHVMESRRRAGIGRFVMRGKAYLVAIVAEGGVLMAETLRFADELRDPGGLAVPDQAEAPAELRRAFERDVKALARKAVDEALLEDRYAARLQALVKKKRKAGARTVQRRTDDDADARTGGIIDLVAVFRARMREAEAENAGERATQDETLESMTRDELYERAQEAGIAGRSKMNKGDLLKALEAES